MLRPRPPNSAAANICRHSSTTRKAGGGPSDVRSKVVQPDCASLHKLLCTRVRSVDAIPLVRRLAYTGLAACSLSQSEIADIFFLLDGGEKDECEEIRSHALDKEIPHHSHRAAARWPP